MWSPPAFMELEKGSWGFQAGAEEVDLVLLMMNEEGMQKLLQDKVTLGAGASIAAGPVGRTARAETDAQMNAQILSYSRSNGIFAGVNLAGGVLHPDEDANRDVYGVTVDVRGILNGAATVKTPPAAEGFLTALQAGSVGTSGR